MAGGDEDLAGQLLWDLSSLRVLTQARINPELEFSVVANLSCSSETRKDEITNLS